MNAKAVLWIAYCNTKSLTNFTKMFFSAFYVDCHSPDYCFVPCGHMASEKTVRYWAEVPIPCGTSGFQVRR